MTNTVIVSHSFKREVKPLAKKYHTLKDSVDKLINDLIENPYLGESYGKNIYKVRLADPSKGKGKSGGFRVMYYHLNISEDGIDVLLMTIFNKSEMSTIKKAEADKILKDVLSEHKRENN
ncbi:type II toxin-antitoxin system RelE/ParE family toxin [Mucilaginibacter psychrotolerans]|uniref:Addiction module toxin RelE n=1 Tax=Mucilaginibacter psychrotolerans TaxID=1524096 RepID=A0A4Y8SJJ9_9SPHI|nr:addiction module toxin RelE [Mucilaginibacter psychrotolerans]TFF38851.1 addiction module toxin RelE [Mucilaginibacter psychrotolerans]